MVIVFFALKIKIYPLNDPFVSISVINGLKKRIMDNEMMDNGQCKSHKFLHSIFVSAYFSPILQSRIVNKIK